MKTNEQEREDEYGRCALCKKVFKYGDDIRIVTEAGCGQSQGYPCLYENETEAMRFHKDCLEKIAPNLFPAVH